MKWKQTNKQKQRQKHCPALPCQSWTDLRSLFDVDVYMQFYKIMRTFEMICWSRVMLTASILHHHLVKINYAPPDTKKTHRAAGAFWPSPSLQLTQSEADWLHAWFQLKQPPLPKFEQKTTFPNTYLRQECPSRNQRFGPQFSPS